MKTLLVAIVMLFTFCAQSQSAAPQTKLLLDTIKDFRIKIDGGCSFYSYDSVAVEKKQFIFVVSARKIGFINISGRPDYTYLKRIQVSKLADAYTQEIFTGDGIKAILSTKEIGKRTSYPYSVRSGSLTITGKINQTIKVHGTADEL